MPIPKRPDKGEDEHRKCQHQKINQHIR